VRFCENELSTPHGGARLKLLLVYHEGSTVRDSFALAVNQLLRYHTRLLQDYPSRRVKVAPAQHDGLIDPPPKWIPLCDWQCAWRPL
jgi:hypothetical protein